MPVTAARAGPAIIASAMTPPASTAPLRLPMLEIGLLHDVEHERNCRPHRQGQTETGDAFNLAGSHIRLFMALVETDTGTRFRVIEAANGEGRIGRVIEQTYTASQLSSYVAIR